MALTPNLPADVARIIQLAVAPVFLLSGVGVTLGVFTNRLSRIVDRARALEQQLAHDAENPDLIKGLAVLARRARYINAAITLITLSALFIALVVVMLFVNAFLRWDLAAFIAAMFILSMLSLATALSSFLIEVRIATKSLRIGIEEASRQDE